MPKLLGVDYQITSNLIQDNTIVPADLNTTTTQYLLPTGSILTFAGATAPTGFLLCDGKSYSKADYPALYAVISNIYGSVDMSHFNVPDLRGRFLRMVDYSPNVTPNVSGRDPDSGSRSIMNTGGSAGNNVGSVQTDAFQGHWHSLYGFFSNGITGTAAEPLRSDGTNTKDGYVKDPATDGTHGIPRTSSETRPQNAYILYCIKT